MLVRKGTVTTIALVAALGLASGAGATPDQRTIQVKDKCDPATFNAVLGDGACVGNGDVTFDAFIAELEATHTVGSWRFAPGQATLSSGTALVADNTGGEFHTFTQVAEFGPGVVPILNLLTFGVLGPPQPEFLQPFNATTHIALPAGTTATIPSLAPGVHRFQCAIHPWMQTTVDVR
jgi:plastocyanin